jgi:hypothetical protein
VVSTDEFRARQTIEFDGPANEPTPPDIVTKCGQQQHNAIKPQLSTSVVSSQ